MSNGTFAVQDQFKRIAAAVATSREGHRTKSCPKRKSPTPRQGLELRHRARKCGFTLKSRDNAYRLMVGTDFILAGTLECISAYLAVQDVPSKPTPPRILSTTYDAIAKQARRRAYIVRKTRLGYTMTRGGGQID